MSVQKPSSSIRRAGYHFIALAAFLVSVAVPTSALAQEKPSDQATPKATPSTPATTPKPPSVAKKPASTKHAGKPQPSSNIPSLEDMLAEALTNSPEIRVAAAAVRQSEAELERVRYDVAQKVIALHGKIQEQRTNIEKTRAIYEDEQSLHEKGYSTVEGVTKARVALTQAEDKLKEAMAQLPFTLGRQMRQNILTRVYPIPVQDKELLPRIAELMRSILSERDGTVSVEPFAPNNSLVISGTEAQHDKASQTLTRLRELGALDRGVPSMYRLKNPGFMQRLSKAVHQPCTFSFDETPLDDVVALLSEYTDLNISLVTPAKVPVTMTLSGVPLGAAIQALEDKYSLRFYVREYGILACDANYTVDSAIRLVDFWKNVPPPDSPSEPTTKPTPPATDTKAKKPPQ